METILKGMILKLCKKNKWDWENHVKSVVKYSKILAKKMKADKEICEVSAWLHDIIKIKHSKAKSHHIKGSIEAEKILKNLNYPEDKIKKIKQCILTHSSDKKYQPKSKEARILASADALSHFDNPISNIYFALVIKKQNTKEAKKTLIKKAKNNWNKLIPEAKKIAKPKYEAIKLLFED
tara:strand:- start:73 stop:612 length:540 start_codon:yes stop_codon:yes gene_type:complete